ncbi:MAG TPA: sigma factor [Solirubrobacteraceae bacterium]|jgi:RNA polymerase sigma-70 factor (ECF subfamily)
MTPDDEDGAVLARSVGEPAAFAAIYERHAGHVLRYVRRRLGDAVAEDATTEVFVRAFKRTRGSARSTAARSGGSSATARPADFGGC